MMSNFVLVIALVAALFVVISAWEEVRELRLPGQLRIANEGLSHDDKFWYISNAHVLYKTEIDPMTIVQTNYHAIPSELGQRRFDHIGDIDVFEGVIYGGLESDKEKQGILAAWNASDLSILRYSETAQEGMPWVAVDSTSRQLYSAVWNDCCNLQVYDVDTFAYKGSVTAVNGLPREIQGAAFYQNELYLAVNGNCSIYKMNLQTREVSFVLSDQYRKYQYEMEGLSFWDLTHKGLGVMHFYGNFMEVKEKGVRNYKP